MAIVVRICVFLMLIGIADTKEWRPETFVNGENVTVCIDGLQTKGTQILQIHFAGFISKQHVSNVLLYNPMKNKSDQISVNINYTGRIEKFEMNKSSLSFLLLNVKFMDSGTYTVSALEGSVVNGETSILVARQRILGHHGDSMNITFMCTKTNISSIKIEMIVSKDSYPVVIYDVTQANCTEVGELFKNRIESCVFSGIRFSFTIRSVTWLEMNTYVALDDMKFLLDSVFVAIEDTKTSSLETSKGYVTLPSTVNGPTDSSKFAKETDVMTGLQDQVDNVNDIIDVLETDGSLSSKINVSGYSNMLLVKNVMLHDHKKNTSYVGHIEMIVIRKDKLSFQLLNVTFFHNGNDKILENSCENRNEIILVFRRRLGNQDGESETRVFMCNNTNIYSIKPDIMQTSITSYVGFHNMTHEKCTLVTQRYTARIKGCPFSENNPSFTFPEVSWFKGAMFAAYNDSELLLDSIYIDIQSSSTETGNEYQTSSSGALFDQPSSNDKSVLLLVSAVVIVIVAAFLAMIAFWMIRHRKVPTTTTNEITYMNRRATTANSPGNLYKNTQEAIPPEETRLVSGTNYNAVNLTDLKKGQVNVRLKEENSIHRRFDCADSSTRTTRNYQIDSLVHLYDYIPEYHDHCWPYESNFRSSPNSTESIAEQRIDYDYVVQHSFMTLRPPAPDPVVTRKSKVRGTRDNYISWYKRLNIKSASRLNPLRSYAEINKERCIESNCTVSSSEPGSCYLMNQLAPSSYFELECIRATGTRNSPSWFKYGEGQNWRNVENLNSTNFVQKPEVLELRDMPNHRRVAQFLNYDLPRCHFDHPCSMDRRHRRSQSLNDIMAIASIRWSRRRSARSCMKNDCYYDSL